MKRNDVRNCVLGDEFKSFQRDSKRVMYKICLRMTSPPFIKMRRMMEKIKKKDFFAIFPPILEWAYKQTEGKWDYLKVQGQSKNF